MTEFLGLIDLAAEALGGAVLYANDDFFAEKENLLKAKKPVFLEHEYTDRGKWMDGWESRRKRVLPGHDFAIVRLGLSGIVRGAEIDTAFFRGNYPEHASIEGCSARLDADVETLLGPGTRWIELLPKSSLKGDSKNHFAVEIPLRVTHLRLNIFPDGGVARLRVHGDVMPDWRRLGRGGTEIDLAAIENGAVSVVCSDMFFGSRHNLLMPGRAPNMGDGWETKRRRGPGHDWNLVQLAAEGVIRRLEIDTNHFKGNYPDTCSVEGIRAPGATEEELTSSSSWVEVLPRTKMQAHTRHFFEEELRSIGPFTHLRLNVFPDGGVSRLRVTGVVTEEGLAVARLARLNSLSLTEAEEELLSCCASHAWASRMTGRRPFPSPEALLAAADKECAALSPEDWREAFLAHPRIGEKKAEKTAPGEAKRWAGEEQSGTRSASEATLRELAEKNRAYDEKFGHVFLICATGKTAEEMLAALDARLRNDATTELSIAAEEQRKITQLRLGKLLRS
jgi:allantoicase